MTKQKQKNMLASVGGGGGVLALIVWLVAQFGQADATAEGLKRQTDIYSRATIENARDHKDIQDQITVIEVEFAETKTRSETQHEETLRRFDELVQMIRDIKR